MKAGRIPYPPHPIFESNSPMMSFRAFYLIVEEQCEKELRQAFMDEFTFGIGGVHISEAGEVERLDPMTVEDKIRKAAAEGNFMKVNWLTVDEIIERYPLTEEQIKQLKNHERK